MRCIWYETIEEFIKETWELLLVYEVQNNLLMGNAKRELEGGKANEVKVTVKDKEGQIKLIGIMVEPFNLVLYEINNEPCNEALETLAKALIEVGIELPGVIGESKLAQRFSEYYSACKGTGYKTKLSLNLMLLTELIEPKYVKGHVRLATENDLYFLPYWKQSFAKEAGIHIPNLEESVTSIKNSIQKKRCYIWEDGYPVSSVSGSRSLENGIGIAFVYTPPMFRGKGYARSCAAAVTKILLEEGYQFCYLFADQKNPTSNGIYKKLGYKEQCIFDEIIFE